MVPIGEGHLIPHLIGQLPLQVHRLPLDRLMGKAVQLLHFRITDDNLGVGSLREKFRRNMDAINTLQAIELEGRTATPAEQEILSRYVGWGGLSQAFDENRSKKSLGKLVFSKPRTVILASG